MSLSLCSQGSRESLCSEILVFVEVHQHHDTLSWIQLSSHSISLLLSAASFEVLQVSRCCWASTEAPPSPFTSLNPYFLGHQGHHTMSCSVAFPTWHPGLGSLLLMSEEDFTSVFPLSHKFLLLLISELIFTSLGRAWAHFLPADRAAQCLPRLWCS